MQAYLRAQGQWFVHSTAWPADETDHWDKHNEKALSNITLRVKDNYSLPSISSAYAELNHFLTMTIPTGSHPAPPITKMLSHFTYLKDAGFDFPAPVQAMIILHKLPPTMEVAAQILSQTAPSEIRNLELDGIVKAATLSFEQKGASRGGSGKAP